MHRKTACARRPVRYGNRFNLSNYFFFFFGTKLLWVAYSCVCAGIRFFFYVRCYRHRPRARFYYYYYHCHHHPRRVSYVEWNSMTEKCFGNTHFDRRKAAARTSGMRAWWVLILFDIRYKLNCRSNFRKKKILKLWCYHKMMFRYTTDMLIWIVPILILNHNTRQTDPVIHPLPPTHHNFWSSVQSPFTAKSCLRIWYTRGAVNILLCSIPVARFEVTGVIATTRHRGAPDTVVAVAAAAADRRPVGRRRWWCKATAASTAHEGFSDGTEEEPVTSAAVPANCVALSHAARRNIPLAL